MLLWLILQWSDLCKSFLLEAKWYYSGYTPSLQEYISNSWISISGPVLLVHAYFLAANPITKEALQSLERYHNIIRWSSMISRLSDDLGTSLVCMLLSLTISLRVLINVYFCNFCSWTHYNGFFYAGLRMSWKEEMFPSQSSVTCMKLVLLKKKPVNT